MEADGDGAAFLAGVFLITFAVLMFQVVQTRILSVIAWYYLAFFAISVAMLGMTAGAVWVYLRRDRLAPDTLSTALSHSSLLAAVGTTTGCGTTAVFCRYATDPCARDADCPKETSMYGRMCVPNTNGHGTRCVDIPPPRP